MLAREHARREHGLADAAPERLWAHRAHAELLRLARGVRSAHCGGEEGEGRRRARSAVGALALDVAEARYLLAGAEVRTTHQTRRVHWWRRGSLRLGVWFRVCGMTFALGIGL